MVWIENLIKFLEVAILNQRNDDRIKDSVPGKGQVRRIEPLPVKKIPANQSPDRVNTQKVALKRAKIHGAMDLPMVEQNSKRGKVRKFLFFESFGKPGSIDIVFLLILLLIIGAGTVMSFSASYAYSQKKYDSSYSLLVSHMTNLAFAFILFLGATFSPPEIYKGVTYFITAISVILLVLVLFIGVVRNGAKRWIQPPIGPMFQPSEIAKLAIVMLLALLLSQYCKKVTGKKIGESFVFGFLIPSSILAVYMGLLFFENHYSAIIIFFSITVIMMTLGGSRKLWIALLLIVAMLGIGYLIMNSSYARERISIWRDPWKDEKNKGWQTIQGLYAIASGGFFGVGLGNSIQKYGYVSEPQNDFVFTIVCEELGFVGAFAIILLFVFLVIRGFHIAKNSPNRYTYLLVMGIMVKLALQVGFNIAVVTKLFPNTGISLPFFSSGGTQLVLQMIEMGLVLSISRYSYVKK